MKKQIALATLIGVLGAGGWGMVNEAVAHEQKAPVIQPKAANITAKPSVTVAPAQGKDVVKAAPAVPLEPGAHEMCAYCNMMVYPQQHQMGAFTAQVEMANGKHLYFDDVGCLLNYLRTSKEAPKGAWVRDYNSKQWIDYKTAVPVSAAIQTPMRYGVGLFKDEASAQAFIKANPQKKAIKTSWDAINLEAFKRYQKRMAMMKQHQQRMQQGHMKP